MSHTSLPPEIISEIISHVPSQSILPLRLVNSTFESILKPKIDRAWPEPYDILTMSPGFIPPSISTVVLNLRFGGKEKGNPSCSLQPGCLSELEPRLKANVNSKTFRTLVLHTSSNLDDTIAFEELDDFVGTRMEELVKPGDPFSGIVNLDVSFLPAHEHADNSFGPDWRPTIAPQEELIWDVIGLANDICPAFCALRYTQEVCRWCPEDRTCFNHWIRLWRRISHPEAELDALTSLRVDVVDVLPEGCAHELGRYRGITLGDPETPAWRSKIVWSKSLTQLVLSFPQPTCILDGRRPLSGDFQPVSFHFLRFVLQNEAQCATLTVLELFDTKIFHDAVPEEDETFGGQHLSSATPCAFPNLKRLTLVNVAVSGVRTSLGREVGPDWQQGLASFAKMFTSIFADLRSLEIVEVGMSTLQGDIQDPSTSLFREILQSKARSTGWPALSRLGINSLIARRIITEEPDLWRKLQNTFVLVPLSTDREWMEDSWKR